MVHPEMPLSYDEMRHSFQESLDCALTGGVPAPVSDMPQVVLMLTLLDVTYAVRANRPTEELVTRALEAFAQYASSHDEARWLSEKAGIDVW